MAEEEVLHEEVAKPRREKSGMSPAVILGVLVLGIVIIVGFIIMTWGKIKTVGVNVAKGEQTIEKVECKGKKFRVFYLSPEEAEMGIRYTLKDGNYIITKIAFCVDAKIPDEEIAADKAVIGSILTTFFLRYKMDQVFLPSKEPVEGTEQTEPETHTPDLLQTEEESMGETALTPSQKFEELEKKLAMELKGNLEYVESVYLWEIDVVPGIPK